MESGGPPRLARLDSARLAKTLVDARRVKIIVILGPTASGKSDVAIKLAKKFALSKIEGFDGAEIISADSRQVYRHMNIGTGKVTGRLRLVIPSKRSASRDLVFISAGIPHHMIDIISPKTDYNVAKFKKAVDKIIPEIISRGKLPIICGGTGFWIKAIIDNVNFPPVEPNKELRNKLRNKSAPELIQELKKLDPERAKNIDPHNKVRLIRAIEIATALGHVPKLNFQFPRLPKPGTGGQAISNFQFLQIGIKIPKEKLYKNIKKRLEARFRQGMIKEIKKLHYKDGVSWKRLEAFGLEYKWIALYLQNKISKVEMKEKLLQEIKNYAKRQMTWWRKDKRIRWTKSTNIMNCVKKFLSPRR